MAVMSAILLATALGSAPTEGDRTVAVKLARQTLARELGVSDQQIRVEDARRVEWPDAGLGCPEKGEEYAQVVVPGYSVSLDVAGRAYRVHVGGGRAVLCERAGAAPKYMEVVVRLQERARRDLAVRLAIEAKEVKVLRIRPQTWPDAGLGCAAPGQHFEPAETKGFLIELEHAGKIYRYHSDRERVMLCEK